MYQIKMDDEKLLSRDIKEIDDVYNECIHYLENIKKYNDEREKHAEDVLNNIINDPEPHYETVRLEEKGKTPGTNIAETKEAIYEEVNNTKFKIVNETKSTESDISIPGEVKSVRLGKLSQQLPKIIITESNTSLNVDKDNKVKVTKEIILEKPKRNDQKKIHYNGYRRAPPLRNKTAYGDYPKRLVAKNGAENVALISNVPFEKIRLLNDTFHTMINLRWRWIVISTIVMHFTIWLVFAVFWYIAALAHYDFEPDPPKRTCVTGGKDFVTIFLASVEAQTTIGFGDRAIDEECPESIFLFIMQLILGTGLSGVLTCVVYAKLTRPEKLSKDGVGFSKKAVISMRDGQLCFMVRVWDLNYDHIISSEITAHFVYTHKTSEGEVLRYYTRPLPLLQQQFLLWPVTVVHVIDDTSPLFTYTPDLINSTNFEVTLSLKGASASMGTFTQSQTSYLPKEVLWGHRFLPVVKYDPQKQTYVIDHKRLDATEPVETPRCSARDLISSKLSTKSEPELRSGTPNSFSEKVTAFVLERSSSFKRKDTKS